MESYHIGSVGRKEKESFCGLCQMLFLCEYYQAIINVFVCGSTLKPKTFLENPSIQKL